MFALVLSLIGGHCLAQWRASGHGGKWTPSLWACILVSGAWLLAGNPTACVLLGQRNTRQVDAAASAGEALSDADATWVRQLYRG